MPTIYYITIKLYNMKQNNILLRTILIISVLSLYFELQAQYAFEVFAKEISLKGKNVTRFKLRAYLRTETKDIEGGSTLFIQAAKVDSAKKFINKMVKYSSPEYVTSNQGLINEPKWQEVYMEDTLPADCNVFYLGLFSNYNGNFFIDNISLQFQTPEQGWTIAYKNDFETSGSLLEQGNKKRGKNDLYSTKLTTTLPQSGRQSMQIIGKGIPTYGVNPAAGKFADVNGIKLYYEIYGKGQPLLVLHGNGGSISNATEFYPDLIKKYKVIGIDSRGQGKSTDTDEPLTYEQMASDIHELLLQLKIDSVLIWGHSDGAILGLILAMQYPKQVKKVLAFGANIQPDSNAIYPADTEKMRKIIRKEGTPKSQQKLMQLMIDHPNIPYEQLSKIQIPVLIMAGDRDMIRPEHTLRLFQHIPQSNLCIIPGATHGAAWEKQALFKQLMFEFFDKPFTMPDSKSLLDMY